MYLCILQIFFTLKLQVFDSEYYFKINLKTLCTEQYFRYDSLQKITMKSLVKDFFLKGGNYKEKIIQGIIIVYLYNKKKNAFNLCILF